MARLSNDGIESYVKVIIDLWRAQQALDGTLTAPHTRGKAVKQFSTERKRSAARLKRETYTDRGAGTVQDTYSGEEMKRISNYFMAQANGRGLGDRLDFLLGHALMARGESARFIQLPDLFSMEPQNEGPTPCNVLVMIMHQGKTN